MSEKNAVPEKRETVLKLSELLGEDNYKVFNGFLSNMYYPFGAKLVELCQEIANSAYNQAIQDKNAIPLPTKKVEEDAVDVAVVPNRDALIAEALAAVETTVEDNDVEESDENVDVSKD